MIDAPPDAPAADPCPDRTQPAGVPEHLYAASEIHLGDVTVHSATEVAALAGIKMISGSLTIASPLDIASLPDLEVITNDLVTASTTIATIDLPRLETVGGRVNARVATSSPLTLWSTPRLESLGTFMSLVAHQVDLACLASVPLQVSLSQVQQPIVLPRLADTGTADFELLETTSIALPALRDHLLQVRNCTQLTTVVAAGPKTIDIRTVPALASITLSPGAATQAVELDGISSLQTLDFLVDAAQLSTLAISGATVLHSVVGAARPALASLSIVDAPVLTDLGAVGGSTITGDLILRNTGLAAISFPNVTNLTSQFIGVLSIRDNASLTTLALPNLTVLGAADHFITDNPMLPTAQATAIRGHVTLAPGGTFTIQNNLP